MARAAYLCWALIVCPLLAWWIGVGWLSEATDPAILGIGLYFGTPAVLSAVVGVAARRPTAEVIVATVAAVALAAVCVLVMLAWLDANGAFS